MAEQTYSTQVLDHLGIVAGVCQQALSFDATDKSKRPQNLAKMPQIAAFPTSNWRFALVDLFVRLIVQTIVNTAIVKSCYDSMTVQLIFPQFAGMAPPSHKTELGSSI